MYDKKETPTKIIVGVSFLLKHLAEATRPEPYSFYTYISIR